MVKKPRISMEWSRVEAENGQDRSSANFNGSAPTTISLRTKALQ